jgi:hypothetical protein
VLAGGGQPAVTPHNAHLDRAWYVGRGQVLVEWHRVERVSPKGGGERYKAPYTVWRLVLWTRDKGWHPRYVIAGPTVLSPIDDVRFADLTHDGRRDLLVSDVQGNHGSGPYRVLAGGPRPATILAGDWSESSWRVRHGVLTIVEPRGGQSVCCPDFHAYLTYRWNGKRLVLASTRLVRLRY